MTLPKQFDVLPAPSMQDDDREESCVIYRWYLSGMTAIWFVEDDGFSHGLVFHRTPDSTELISHDGPSPQDEFIQIVKSHIEKLKELP